MGDTLTKSMAALHTWAGVTIGALLFAIFWMGTLSVFSNEIDRWMLPDTRVGVRDASTVPSLSPALSLSLIVLILAAAIIPSVIAARRERHEQCRT